MKIDIFNHIFPKKYFDRMVEVAPKGKDMHKRVREIPCIVDLDERFRIMDRFDDYTQVICLGAPPVEVFGPPPVSTEMAKTANDGMAELVRKYPARFPGFIASLPMNDPEGLLREARRAVKELGAVGVQIFTNVLGRSLDKPETMPLFDLMAELDRPLWLHPARGADFPDYKGEPKSHYEIWWTFGWPYETSVAMAHLVFAGLFDKHPDIKIITHHMGAMIPHFSNRAEAFYENRKIYPDAKFKTLPKAPSEYFKRFYGDTVLEGAVNAFECGYSFFGPDHMIFATDYPFGPREGEAEMEGSLHQVRSVDLPQTEKERILGGNLQRLLERR